MKIGVRAHDFGRHHVSDLPQIISNAGFETVQLAITKAISSITAFTEINDDLLFSIRESFETHGVDISVLGCYIEPSLYDKEKRMQNVALFKLGIEHAKKLGVNIVGTETTNLDIETSTSEREKAYQLLKDSILRMSETAEKMDVCIGIEPVAEHVLNTPELAARLFDEVDSNKLRIIFDPVNLVLSNTINRQNEIYRQLFDFFGSKIAVLHIKDTTFDGKNKVWQNIGKGLIDYNFIFSLLRRYTPKIPLLREGVAMDSYQKDIKTMHTLIQRTY